MDITRSEAINFLIKKIEGDYTTDDPDDNGGETSFGLLKSEVIEKGYAWPIDYDFAVYFFGKYYWQSVGLDWISSPLIRYRLFVDGVHVGSHRPVKYLQRVLNANNNRGTRWDDLKVDGLLGPNTAREFKRASRRYSTLSVMDNEIRALTYNRYLRIVEADESQEKWFRGWKLRLAKYPTER